MQIAGKTSDVKTRKSRRDVTIIRLARQKILNVIAFSISKVSKILTGIILKHF
jgi:hypothetical protein